MIFASYLVFLIDRILKILIINISENSEIFLIPKILSLEFYKNYGAAFGLKIPIFLIIVFSIIVLFLTLFLIKKDFYKRIPHWVFVFLFLGALSNIFDRIYYGYVIDTFNFLNISFFNLADGMIIVGLVGIFWWYRKR